MVESIYEAKNKILERIRSDLQERGVERMDVAEMGKLVDMVKDLAEAEKCCWESDYYRAVIEAMDNAAGYDSMGYNGYSSGGQSGSRGGSQSRSGWANQYGSGQSRRGYGMPGYQGPMPMNARRMDMMHNGTTPDMQEMGMM